MIQPDGVHTIPVPQGWSIEQAWEHILRGTPMKASHPRWAVVVVKNGQIERYL